MAAAVRESRSSGGRGAKPATEAQSTSDRGGYRAAGGGVATTAAGLGSEEAAGAAGARRAAGAADHDTPDFVATRFGAGRGSAAASGAAVRAREAERAMADGFQRAGRMEWGGGAAVGAGRSQPVRDRAVGNGDDASGGGAGAVGRGV